MASQVSQAQVNNLVLNFILNDPKWPFTCVQNEDLRELIAGLLPMKKVPCYKTVTGLLENFEAMLTNVKKELGKATHQMVIPCVGLTSVLKIFLGCTTT